MRKIVTDAGIETIAYNDALEFFTEQKIRSWWLEITENWELDLLFDELEISIDLDNEEAVEEFLENYNTLPKTVALICARAVCGKEKWIKILRLSPYGLFQSSYEEEAIMLGVKLRDYLQEDLLIINDNKDAVKKLKPTIPNLFWQRRNKVEKADKLRLNAATKIFSEK